MSCYQIFWDHLCCVTDLPELVLITIRFGKIPMYIHNSQSFQGYNTACPWDNNTRFLDFFRGDECHARASICVGRRVWRHNTALKFLWNTWTNFTFMRQQSHVYIPYTFFSGLLYFFVMFQSYCELVIITLQFAYWNMFSRFFHFQSLGLKLTIKSIECFHRLFM